MRKWPQQKTLLKAAAEASSRRIDRDAGNVPETSARSCGGSTESSSGGPHRRSFVARPRLGGLRHDDAVQRYTGAAIRREIEDRRLECARRLVLDSDLDFRRDRWAGSATAGSGSSATPCLPVAGPRRESQSPTPQNFPATPYAMIRSCGEEAGQPHSPRGVGDALRPPRSSAGGRRAAIVALLAPGAASGWGHARRGIFTS